MKTIQPVSPDTPHRYWADEFFALGDLERKELCASTLAYRRSLSTDDHRVLVDAAIGELAIAVRSLGVDVDRDCPSAAYFERQGLLNTPQRTREVTAT